jgi:hypothetical protein
MRNYMKLMASNLKWLVMMYVILGFFAPSTFSQRGIRPFLEAEGQKPSQPQLHDFDKWSFSLGGFRYEVDKSGIGRRLDSRGKYTRFRVRIQNDEWMERVVYYAEFKRDLLLLCEVNAGGYGSGFVVRLDGRTLRQVWRVHIPAFNVAQGLIENNSAYLAAIGFVAKLNLDSGRYLWKHDNLYRKYRKEGAFNIFELPEIVGKDVIYTENQEMNNRKPNTIRLNKQTGRVLKVELNP